MVFTVFVLLQVFNMVNARMINDEFNVLKRVCENWMFVSIFLIILFLQYLITEFT